MPVPSQINKIRISETLELIFSKCSAGDSKMVSRLRNADLIQAFIQHSLVIYYAITLN